jgi:transcriptional regulator with XRE-family HTH domain
MHAIRYFSHLVALLRLNRGIHLSKTLELLDVAKERNGITSDYRLAKVLDVPQATISNYRCGRSRPDLPTTLRLAELAGTDPDQAWVAICVERAVSKNDRETWARIGQKLMALDSIQKPH